MKKTYQTPWLETLTTEAEDIIRTSSAFKLLGSVEENGSFDGGDSVNWKW